MGARSKTTEFLKECMADALLNLMRRKPCEQISITEITEEAGVGRSTWFRNFADKNEALCFKLVQSWQHWLDEHKPERDPLDWALNFFRFHYEYRSILALLYRSKLQPTLLNAITQIVLPAADTDPEGSYRSSLVSHSLFGMLDEWIRRNFSEPPEELAELFCRLTKGQPVIA